MDFSQVKKWKIPVNGEMKEVKQVTHNGTVLWKGTHIVTWRYQASYGVWTTTTEEYDDGATPSRANAHTVADGNTRDVFDEWDDLSPVTEDRTITAIYHREYNVTSLNGTNCNAYAEWGWTTPFTTGWHRTTDKIYWHATDAYCYTWTNTNFVEWSTVDVMPGVNSSTANLIKRWAYNINLSNEYQVVSSTPHGYIKVWRTSSPYEGAEISTEANPMLSTIAGVESAYVYYGDVLCGKAETDVGYNFSGYSNIGDRDDVLRTFTNETVQSSVNVDWRLYVYPNPYELTLNQNYGEWNLHCEWGDIGYVHLDGEISELPILFVHTGTTIAYGYDKDGVADPSKIRVMDYTPEYDGRAFDVEFLTPSDSETYEYTFLGFTGPTTISGDGGAVASVARRGIVDTVLYLDGQFGTWSYDDPAYNPETGEVPAHVGDAVIIANNVVTIGPNPVGPYSQDVHTLTWTTQSSDHDYTYTFDEIVFTNNLGTNEISGDGDSVEASVTQTPNPFTITWRWQSSYGTWATATEVYHYGDTPSRATPATVTDGNQRNYSLGWDDLSEVTDDRTITATYKSQYNVTSLSGTHCTAPSSYLGWHDTTDKITWTSTMPYCFDYKGTSPYNVTTLDTTVVAGVNSASAINIYRYQYYIRLSNPNSASSRQVGYMKIWRTYSSTGLTPDTEANPTAEVDAVSHTSATIWAYYGDIFSGKAAVTDSHYNLGNGSSDTERTFNNQEIDSAHSWTIDIMSNTYNIFLTQTVRGIDSNLVENSGDLPAEGYYQLALPHIGEGAYILDFTVAENITGTYDLMDMTNNVPLAENVPFTQGVNHCPVVLDAEYYQGHYGVSPIDITQMDLTLHSDDTATITALTFKHGTCWDWANYTTTTGTISAVPVVIVHYGTDIFYDTTHGTNPYIRIQDYDDSSNSTYDIEFVVPDVSDYELVFNSFTGPDSVTGDASINAAVAQHGLTEVAVDLEYDMIMDPDLPVPGSCGHWEDENGSEVTVLEVYNGDVVSVSNNVATVGPNPVGPYTEYVHTYTWVTDTSPAEYTYTFNRIELLQYIDDEWVPATEVTENYACKIVAYVTIIPNPFTVIWRYQSSYGTWTTVTDTTSYHYGDYPSRTAPSNVTGTNVRDINGEWDDLSMLTESTMTRTINAEYTTQYNVTSVSGTNCVGYSSSAHTTAFATGWHNTGDIIYWLANAAYAFDDTNNTSAITSSIVPGVNSASAPYVKHWYYRVYLRGNNADMRVWRTSSPYQHATEGSTEANPLVHRTSYGEDMRVVYYGDVLSGKIVTSTGYNLGNGNDDTMETFSGTQILSQPSFYAWEKWTYANVYELGLHCNYGSWNWSQYNHIDGNQADYPIVIIHYGAVITCEGSNITIEDPDSQYQNPLYIDFNTPADTSSYEYSFISITVPSTITGNASAVASVARHGLNEWLIDLTYDGAGHWEDEHGDVPSSRISAYEGDDVIISNNTVTIGPNPVGPYVEYIHTYTWITDSSTAQYTITFDRIEFDGYYNICAYDTVTPNPGKAYITKGTGVTGVYISTSATATSGSASGATTYNGGTTVYGFAIVQAGYHMPSTSVLISGNLYAEGAIYRVDYWEIAGDVNFGTINATINSYNLSGTYTNGSVTFKNANNQIITQANYGDTVTCIGTGSTGYNSTSTSKVLNPTNFTLTYGANWTASINLGTASRISGSLSQGTLPTGVASLICYRKAWNGSSFSVFTSGTIYYGDQFYWTATATTGYNNPTVTYYDASHVYTWTGSQGGSITSVNASGLVAGSLKRFTVTWKNWNGTVLETDTNVAYGSTPSYNSATPTRSATAQYTYTFSSWSPEPATVTSDQVYTAQFSQVVNKYTVTWKNWNGTVLETDTNVPYGEECTYNGTTPTRPTDNIGTYTFDGWSGERYVYGNTEKVAQFDVEYFNYNLNLSSNVLEAYSNNNGPWYCREVDRMFPDPQEEWRVTVHYGAAYNFDGAYLVIENAIVWAGETQVTAGGQLRLEASPITGSVGGYDYAEGFGLSGIVWGDGTFNTTTPFAILIQSRLGTSEITINDIGGDCGNWYDENDDVIGQIFARNGDSVSISGNTITIGPNPVGPFTDYVHTYHYVVDTQTWENQYIVTFNHIEFTVGGEPATSVDFSGNGIYAYCTFTPKPGKAYITKGTGVSNVYLSTNASATSGSASGTTTYNGGDRVYGFAIVEAGYVIPSDWVRVAAATSTTGAKYRVGYWDIAGDVYFGTINLDRISATLSRGTLPTGVSGITCYRKAWNGSSYTTFTSGTIYYGDQFYWEATASTGYYNPSVTYGSASNVYTFTGPDGTSVNSVTLSGLSAGARRTWSLTVSKNNYMSKVYYKINSGSTVEVTSSVTLSPLDYGDTVTVSGTAQSEAPYNYGTPTGTGTYSYSATQESKTAAVSCTRSVKSYTLTISTTNASYGTYSVSRTSSPYQGASTGTLSNGATIYYGDVLTGTSSGNGTSYGSWNISSVTAPTVTSTGDATTGNITVTNNDSNAVTLYYNTSNTTGGTSLGDASSGGTKTKTGLSFSTTYYCSAARSRSRDKYVDTASGSNYTGTNGVTGNVTATFTFSRTTTTDTGTVYSSIVSHKTAARNSYTLTVNKGYYKITGVNSKSSSSTGDGTYTNTYLYGESYSYTYNKTGYTSQSVSGTITGTTTHTLTLSPTQYTLGKNLTNWTGAWYTTNAYSSTITYRYYGYAAYFRATPNAKYYADIGGTHYYTGVYYTDSVATTSTSNASVTLSATALGQYTLTINVTNGSYGTYSVSRTYTESGQGTGVLSNGATIYQNDVLSGTSSGNGTSYTPWSVSSVTAPTVTSTGAATSGNITVTNKDGSTATLYYNTTNATGGTSLGSTSAGGTQTKTGLSFSTTYYCSAVRQASRTKHVDSKNNDNYTGTSGVSSNVTASFVFSRSDTTEYQDVWSSVTSHTTAAQNTYTVTWKNWDGTTLETDSNVPYGGSASYNGSTPTRPTTAQYTYTFNSWSGSSSYVTSNVTRTAQFSETLRDYAITVTAQYLSDYSAQGISPWINQTLGGIGFPNDVWTMRAYYGTSTSIDSTTFRINEVMYYGDGSYDRTDTADFEGRIPQDDGNYSYSFNGISGITDGGQITGNTTITLLVTRVGREVTVYLDGADGYWQGYNESYVEFTAHYGDPVSVSGNRVTIGSTTYTWITNSGDSHYSYAFDYISNNSGESIVTDGCSFSAYVNATPKSGAVTATAGTGVSSVFLSTNANATSGNPSGTTYAGGTRVYVFAVAAAGYYSTAACTGGTQYDTGAIYRVDYWDVAGPTGGSTYSLTPNPTVKWTGTNATATLNGSAMTSGTAYSVLYNSSPEIIVYADVNDRYYISSYSASSATVVDAAPPFTVNKVASNTAYKFTYSNITTGKTMSTTSAVYYSLSTSFSSLPYSGSITYSNSQTESISTTTSNISKYYSGSINYSFTVYSKEVRTGVAGTVTSYGTLVNGEYPYGYPADDFIINSYSKTPATVDATATSLSGNWLGIGNAYHKVVFSFNGPGSTNHTLSVSGTDSAAAYIKDVSYSTTIKNTSTNVSVTTSANRLVMCNQTYLNAGALLSNTTGMNVSPSTFSFGDSISSPTTVSVSYSWAERSITITNGDSSTGCYYHYYYTKPDGTEGSDAVTGYRSATITYRPGTDIRIRCMYKSSLTYGVLYKVDESGCGGQVYTRILYFTTTDVNNQTYKSFTPVNGATYAFLRSNSI